MWDSASATIEWPDAGFPGVRINPLTLVPEITNDDDCQAALAASTDPADRIFVLLVQGDTADAAELLAEARYKDPESLRLRVFEAEVLRVTHRYDPAILLYRQLLAEVAGTPQEPLILQHLGATQYASGRVSAAVEAFTRALDLQVAGAAEATLIYASTVALQRARDVLELAS
ncbi:tetratricopeptide repeat protein [Pseudarthrobacter sp. J75]|uniref:tetratricopeptide repeat protein n=1 Tax=unclassified Pseudarthrobacter TaxID=2647000 RepID=UPI002E80B13C|nr:MULTISPECIES: tetratricopeptide repeat protein [unclassified Pseudarthrobacter]MEE2523374.1 tetratricopeptide repeat protein [Pseudarthrobacter sp. J47]MEE2529339.1 tetratricopeptide repeat protein [Pseudarthrobacter sp. J75]MEE2569220.1 tetratricopeptide repeat protein [Pseudarthrobacter sp. J64]